MNETSIGDSNSIDYNENKSDIKIGNEKEVISSEQIIFECVGCHKQIEKGKEFISFGHILCADCAQLMHVPFVRQKRKIGRNELCPCGSNKKFKHCCIDKIMN